MAKAETMFTPRCLLLTPISSNICNIPVPGSSPAVSYMQR